MIVLVRREGIQLFLVCFLLILQKWEEEKQEHVF
jgi:hypothetical protein